MKTTVENVLNIHAVLVRVSQDKMPAKMAYRLMKLMRETVVEAQAFEKARMDLAVKYGKPVEEGKVKIEKENVAAFQAELVEILNVETELKDTRFTLVELEPLSLTPADIEVLSVLIDEEAE